MTEQRKFVQNVRRRSSHEPIKFEQGVVDSISGTTYNVFIGGDTVSTPMSSFQAVSAGDTVWVITVGNARMLFGKLL